MKAWLTLPTQTEAINTLADVLDSKLQFRMVMLGQDEETTMAESTDPVVQKIWKDKIEMPYTKHSPLNGVYYDEEVLLDLKSGIEPAVYVNFSTSTGDPLVYVAPRPALPHLIHGMGWGFNK